MVPTLTWGLDRVKTTLAMGASARGFSSVEYPRRRTGDRPVAVGVGPGCGNGHGTAGESSRRPDPLLVASFPCSAWERGRRGRRGRFFLFPIPLGAFIE